MNKSGKKTKGGNGNMLLLAGLGIGAVLLFSGKSDAQGNSSASEVMPAGAEGDIPDAPKILAVNSSSTESPLPTGIVSDEEGMEVTSGGMAPTNSNNESSTGDIDMSSLDAETQKEYNEIPRLVSTTLTPKEKAIINSGKLTTALALKRPDLYKATYIQRHGGKTTAGKKKALLQANKAIATAVAAANAAKTGALVKAHAYPAKPQHTFVQSSNGSMVSQSSVTQAAAVHKASSKKHVVKHKAAVKAHVVKPSKGRHPVNPIAKQHPATKKPVVHRHAKKKVAIKRHRP